MLIAQLSNTLQKYRYTILQNLPYLCKTTFLENKKQSYISLVLRIFILAQIYLIF